MKIINGRNTQDTLRKGFDGEDTIQKRHVVYPSILECSFCEHSEPQRSKWCFKRTSIRQKSAHVMPKHFAL